MAQKKSKVHKFPLVGKKYRTSYYDESGKRQYISHADEHELMRIKNVAQEEVAEGRHTSAKEAGTLTEVYLDYYENRKKQDGLTRSYVDNIERHWRLCLSELQVDGRLIAKKNIKEFCKKKLLVAVGEEIAAFQKSKGNTKRYAGAIFTTFQSIITYAISNEKCAPVGREIWRSAEVKWKHRKDNTVRIPPLNNVRRLIEAADLWDREGRQDRLRCEHHRTTNTIDLGDAERRRRHYERTGYKPTPYGLIFRCLSQIGCRPSELRGLTLSNTDDLGLPQGLMLHSNNPGVRLSQSVDRHGQIGELKTSNSYRFVPIGPDLAQRLRQHVEDNDIQCGELLFSTATGKPLNSEPWRIRLHQICNWHDIAWPEALYTLRHVCASMWIKQGRNIKWISVRMGHQTAAFTLDTYGHLWDEDEEDAAAAVDTENMLYGSAVAAE